MDTVRAKYKRLTQYLIDKGLSITTMESATSGQIASLITDTEGSSAVMKGAFITYSNEAKISCGVPAKTIKKYGVYSLETAKKMAKAAFKAYGADIAIAVTGTMGNVDPANGDSVPGQVYVGLRFSKSAHALMKEDVGHHMEMAFELEPQPTRLSYKLKVAELVYDKLDSIFKIED